MEENSNVPDVLSIGSIPNKTLEIGEIEPVFDESVASEPGTIDA